MLHITKIHSTNESGEHTLSAATSKGDVICSLNNVIYKGQHKYGRFPLSMLIFTYVQIVILDELHINKYNDIYFFFLNQMKFLRIGKKNSFFCSHLWRAMTSRTHQWHFSMTILSVYVQIYIWYIYIYVFICFPPQFAASKHFKITALNGKQEYRRLVLGWF